MFSLDYLKQNHKDIHFFGLGFIQLKLDTHMRLHFYTTKYSPIVSDSEVHDHRYSFSSKVLLGSLLNSRYRFLATHVILRTGQEVVLSSPSTHVLSKESCKPLKEAPAEETAGIISLVSAKNYKVGDFYTMADDEFHKVHTREDTITLILRSNKTKEFANVIRPIGVEKVCPFSKEVPKEELWEIVEEMWSKVI